MKKCEECGNKLGVLEGYRHPTLGRDFLLCSHCFDTIHESVVKWREANLPYVGFFKNNSSNKKYQLNMKKMQSYFTPVQKMFQNIWTSTIIQNNNEQNF